VVGLSTSTWRYDRQPDPINTQLLARLTVHASARPRFGYRRLHTLVDREGLHVNHKRIYGVYREAKLQVRRRRRKRLTRGQRPPLALPSRRTERWSMDFMVDTLADGRGFRTLNVVADFTKECVAIEPVQHRPGRRDPRTHSGWLSPHHAQAMTPDRPVQDLTSGHRPGYQATPILQAGGSTSQVRRGPRMRKPADLRAGLRP
jgi:helix-turn-helix protein